MTPAPHAILALESRMPTEENRRPNRNLIPAPAQYVLHSDLIWDLPPPFPRSRAYRPFPDLLQRRASLLPAPHVGEHGGSIGGTCLPSLQRLISSFLPPKKWRTIHGCGWSILRLGITATTSPSMRHLAEHPTHRHCAGDRQLGLCAPTPPSQEAPEVVVVHCAPRIAIFAANLEPGTHAIPIARPHNDWSSRGPPYGARTSIPDRSSAADAWVQTSTIMLADVVLRTCRLHQ
ncbi:hypothetical protein BC628DRAFT_506664 [Trametes gibbosa]|nr:hypothetical protein BC628DRAFT_506664 [Trametes gibbosa]